MKNGRDLSKVFYVFLNEKIINFDYAGVSSGNFTYGNYYYFKKKIKCNNSNNYKKKHLEKKFCSSRQKRKNKKN